MSRPVIEVIELSKKYRVGIQQKKADTFLGSIVQLLRSPITNFRQIRSLSYFDDNDLSLFWALKDVSFTVREGEVLGIIGHNGAGKSTLLKILSRITEPSIGSATIQGRVSALLEVGTGFHPDLTGRENVYMNGTILGMRRREIDKKFDEIVAFSGVEVHLDTPVKFYSSGMKVRLGFAVAAHLEPEILIIDEVLSVGDAEFQKKCLGKMEDVAGQGRTVLFVSHNMMAVKSLCKTGILLNRGTIEKLGTSEEVVNRYLHTYAPRPQVTFGQEDTKAANERVMLMQIEIRSARGDGSFLITEPFQIELTFEYLGQKCNLHTNLFFNLGDGTTVFVAVSPRSTVSKGTYKATCKVPPNLLNDHIYVLDAMIVEDGVRPIFQYRNAMSIQGVEPPREDLWMGKVPGSVRPALPWSLEIEN